MIYESLNSHFGEDRCFRSTLGSQDTNTVCNVCEHQTRIGADNHVIYFTILWRKQICRGIGIVTSRCFPSAAILAKFLHTTLIFMAKFKIKLKLLYIDILYYSLIMYNLTFSSRENLLSYINSSESIARLEYRILREFWGCPFLEISIIFSHSHKSSAIYMMPQLHWRYSINSCSRYMNKYIKKKWKYLKSHFVEHVS